ncbi:cyclin-dependent protein kinase [Encephalitozoon hellem]|nr:cyclin-dependent protein kinase [Encephalitozoon hellem]
MTRYILGSIIGSGTYGEVYEAMDTETKEKVALKRIKLNEREGMPGTALREISILKKLNHRNVISLVSTIHTDTLLTMVFPFIDYELKKYIEMNTGMNVMELINQLICGVHYLHRMNVVHRDLKPQNILVTSDGVLKIADFGLSRSLEIRVPPYSSEVVTLWYRSPELLMGSTSYKFYVDIWSLGCIIYEMITLEPLFPGESKENQLTLIRRKAGTRRSLKNVIEKNLTAPKFLMEIMLRCLDFNYNQRISADEIVEILENEYGAQ